MRILVNGSSVSSGNTAWPSVLQTKIECDLINLSLPGAGNNYITDSTIAELSKRKYDLVLIMWADFMRLDIKIQNPDDFSNTQYTSANQSKLTYHADSQEINYIEKDWVFGVLACGTNAVDAESSVKELFDGYYKFSSHRQHLFSSLIKIISLQNTLKTLNIPYIFMTYHPFVGQHRFPELFKMIDWDQVYQEHLHNIAVSNNWWNTVTNHPTPSAYSHYADLVIQRIEQTTGHLPRRI